MREKTANTAEKWAKELKRQFAKNKVKVANKLRKRCSISLVVREIQSKISITYNCTIHQVGKIKKKNLLIPVLNGVSKYRISLLLRQYSVMV